MRIRDVMQSPSRFSILLFYLALLVLVQTILYAVLPKEVHRGCRRPSTVSTLPTEQMKNEIIYCRPQGDRFTIITGNEYSDAYRKSEAYAPAVIAQFLWIEHGTQFSRYSLWHLSDRSRSLEFYARCGEHGQTQWTTNEQELRSSIARETGKMRHFLGAYNSGTVPVFEIHIVTIKLVANGILILLARRLASVYQRRVLPHINRIMRTDPNACIHCAYDCRDLPTPICPECGQLHSVSNINQMEHAQTQYE